MIKFTETLEKNIKLNQLEDLLCDREYNQELYNELDLFFKTETMKCCDCRGKIKEPKFKVWSYAIIDNDVFDNTIYIKITDLYYDKDWYNCNDYDEEDLREPTPEELLKYFR